MSPQSIPSTTLAAEYDSEPSSSDPLVPIQPVLHWNEIPMWMQIDPYIRRGYRIQLDSFSACFWSLFYAHNEFVNTWSHLLPALLYLCILVGVESDLFNLYTTVEAGQCVQREDILVVQLYVVGTVMCLSASAFFHGTSAHSETMARKLLKLDYVGICVNICVTNISSTYFGLHDKLSWQMFYNSLSVLCGTGLLVSLRGGESDGSKAAWFRVLAFLALMLMGCAPIAHMLLVEGTEGIRGFPLLHTAYMELCYFIGTLFYLSHWPEKKWPETFDIWGASHQIFHVMVVFGQFVYFLGLRSKLVMYCT